MKLASDWKRVLQRAWSIRLMLIAGLLSGLEVAMPYLDGYVDIPPRLFAALSGLTVAAAFVARIIAQKGMSNADQ
ncbi:hypothetical protein GGI64_006263 [Rhizobium leguminosarum]|uniref:Uncharacterized protein n=1 Tax=Rhizobium leguminosarum TaxID=384 RepID=A0A7Z0J1W8_RHILE|nr:hypothetical protein [Rhizobium leguminosarum]NYJ15158.1 hypothetical protein [Rhizobium leguminosarum]